MYSLLFMTAAYNLYFIVYVQITSYSILFITAVYNL